MNSLLNEMTMKIQIPSQKQIHESYIMLGRFQKALNYMRLMFPGGR